MSLEQIKKTLSAAPGVAAWTVAEERLTSHQRYRIFTRTDAERTARTRNVRITVHTRVERDGKPMLGEASFTLTGETGLSPDMVTRAVERAKLVANPVYALPGPAEYTAQDLDDPRVSAEPWELIHQIEADMDRSAGSSPLCASEIFAERKEITVMNSAGFAGTYSATGLFCEFVLLAEDGKQSVECYGMCRARRPEELGAGAAVSRHARWAGDQLVAELPATATLPVVFGEEALDTLFDTFLAHAGARARYEGWSRLTEGKPLIDKVEAEPLTLSVDATLPWQPESRPFDGEGLVNRPVAVVTEGRFENRTAAKRYADYLGIPPTGSGGTTVVACGPTALSDLLAEGPVLHALRFSTFHPNPVTGAFSGELRTAYLHGADGTIRPIRGGSVSGNVWRAFGRARFSAEQAVRSGYTGPAGVRLEGVTVAGSNR